MKHGYVSNSAFIATSLHSSFCTGIRSIISRAQFNMTRKKSSVYLQNCRSISNKLTDLQGLVYSSTYNIIGLTETWLSDSILDSEILPTGYTIYRLDRPSRGGGELLAVDKTIVSQQLSSPINFELLLIRISLHYPINICLVYNPPNASAEYTEELVNFLLSLPTDSSPVLVILMGDFNVPDINWSTLVGSAHFSTQFCDLIFDMNLSQLVDSPIHIQESTLDLVLTNIEDSIHSLIVHNNTNHLTIMILPLIVLIILPFLRKQLIVILVSCSQ